MAHEFFWSKQSFIYISIFLYRIFVYFISVILLFPYALPFCLGRLTQGCLLDFCLLFLHFKISHCSTPQAHTYTLSFGPRVPLLFSLGFSFLAFYLAQLWVLLVPLCFTVVGRFSPLALYGPLRFSLVLVSPMVFTFLVCAIDILYI